MSPPAEILAPLGTSPTTTTLRSGISARLRYTASTASTDGGGSTATAVVDMAATSAADRAGVARRARCTCGNWAQRGELLSLLSVLLVQRVWRVEVMMGWGHMEELQCAAADAPYR
jgi:hypothetical protein